MAGMQRFITYIYAYENGNKGGNAGFAKIEVRNTECRFELHLRGIRHFYGEMQVALFREWEGEIERIPIGGIRIANGNGDARMLLNTEKIGDTGYRFADLEGVLVTGEEEGLFASRWKEGKPISFTREKIRTYQPKVSVQHEAVRTAGGSPEIISDIGPEKSIVNEQTELADIESKDAIPEESETSAPKEIDLQTTEIPMRNVFPQYPWKEIWNNMKSEYPVFLLYNNEEKEITCLRIELKDLRELPKKYWYLGNNSFLLHGFFNYRYIILGEIEDERWFIGVPGVYQHQERVMAAIFGFPEFLPQVTKVNEKEMQKETEPFNRFGYWYHLLDE